MAKGRSARKKTKLTNFLSIIAGTIIGCAITLAILPSRPKAERQRSVAKSPSSTRPKFEFYSELAKSPARTKHNSKATEPKSLKSPTPPIHTMYMVDAGVYSSLAQADALKAKLALHDFKARVETFKSHNKQRKYRVVLGPFQSKQQADTMQNRLQSKLQLSSAVVTKK